MASSRREAAKKVAPPRFLGVCRSSFPHRPQQCSNSPVRPPRSLLSAPKATCLLGVPAPPGVAGVGTVTEPLPDSNLSVTLQPCGKRASSRPFYVSFSLSQTPGLGARSSGISDIIRTLSSHAPTLNRVASCLFRALGVSPRRHKCKKSAISSEFRSPGQRGCGTLSSH